MLETIYQNLSGILATIGDVNKDDMTKCSFPLYNLEFIGETSEPWEMDSLYNTALFEIHCYNKSTATSNARFDNDYTLYIMLNNIKALLNDNITIGNTCQEYAILSAKPVKMGQAEDIVLSEKMVILLELKYGQSRTNPSQVVGS